MRYLLPTVFAVAAVSCLQAGPITLQLDSVTNGTYNYSINIDNPTHQAVEIAFGAEQGISLTGLSGVTGASVTGALALILTGATFTDTSAFFFVNDPQAGEAFDNPPDPFGELHVTSTATAEGLVNYDIPLQFETPILGTVMGPVATPEPATAGLLGLSLLAGATWLRRSKRCGGS